MYGAHSCRLLGNCGVIVLAGLLIVTLVQVLVSLANELASRRIVKNMARRVGATAAPSENDDYDQCACLQ